MGYAKTRKCIVMCVFLFLLRVGRSNGRKNALDDIIVERKCFCQRKSLYLYWLKAYGVVCV